MAEKDALRNRRTVTGSAPDLMISFLLCEKTS